MKTSRNHSKSNGHACIALCFLLVLLQAPPLGAADPPKTKVDPLPTSIEAGAQRKPPFVAGGEDRLAQAWWRLKTLYLGYERETSPCWIDGEDVYDGLQSKLGFKQGHDVDAVPKGLKVSGEELETAIEAGTSAIANLQGEKRLIEQSLAGTAPELSAADRSGLQWRLSQLDKQIEQLEAALSKAPEFRKLQREFEQKGRIPPEMLRVESEIEAGLRHFIEAELDRLGALVKGLRRLRELEMDAQRAYGAAQRAREEQQLVVDGLRAPTSKLAAAQKELASREEKERAARRDLEAAKAGVQGKQAETRSIEAAVIGSGFALSGTREYYSTATQGRIASLEQPCRQAQAAFSLREETYHRDLDEWSRDKEKAEGVPGKIAVNKMALDKTNKDLKALEETMRDRPALEARSAKLGREITELRDRTSPPADEIKKKEAEKKDIDEQITIAKVQETAKTQLDNHRKELETEKEQLDKKKTEHQQRELAIREKEQLLKVWQAQLRDELEYRQMRIYAEFGGPNGIHRAFFMPINAPRSTSTRRTRW